jgi:hypothetical protein
MEHAPSTVPARLVTVISLFFWILLPAAIYLQHKARQEALAAPGLYRPPNKFLDRPVLVLLTFWVAFFLLLAVAFVVMSALGISPV